MDRVGLLSDAFDLARAGLLGYDVALNLTHYLHKEESYLAWDSLSSGLSYISGMLETTEHFGLWRVSLYNVYSYNDCFRRVSDIVSHYLTRQMT